MTTAPDVAIAPRAPELLGQTVVVLGGSAGIGFATARLARAEGADVVLTGRSPERLQAAADELGALGSAAFDATDFDEVARFFAELPDPIDHVLVTAGGPYYAPLWEIDFAKARRNIDEHLLLPIHLARVAAPRMRPGGTLLVVSGTGARRTGVGLGIISAVTEAV